MDIQSALRDGYSQEEIAQEIGKRSGMDTKAALRDGYSLDEIQAEASKRGSSEWRGDTSGRSVKDMQREFILKEGGFKDRAKQYVKDAVPYIRPTVEGLGAGLGGVIGAGGGFLAGAPTVVGAPATAAMGGVAGAGLGYATGKNIMDTIEGNWVSSPTEAATRAVRDISTGAMYEMGGQIAAPIIGSLARGTVAAVKGTPKVITSPVASASGLWNDLAKKSAARRIEASVTRSGPVAERSAVNQAQYDELQQAMPGFDLTPAAITDDVARLKMQQDLQFKSDAAPGLLEAQRMTNRGEVTSYLDQSMPQGSIDDFVKALEQEQAARGTSVINAAGQMGADKEVASKTMRELEQQVNAALKDKANVLYGKVPMEMPIADGMIYGQAIKSRSEALSAMRDARSAGNFDRALEYKAKAGEIENALKKATEPQVDMFGSPINSLANPQDVAALRDANKFYRETYVPTVRQGNTAKNLATDRTGGFRIDDEISAGKYLQTGDAGLASANDFNRTFASTPQAKEALLDYAKRDLLDAATANGTKAPSLKSVDKWLADRMPALGKIGIQDDLKGLQQALQREAEVADFTKVLGQDPAKVLPSLLSARGDKEIVRSMLDLKTLVKGNQSATDGLKKSFADMMMKDSEIVKQVGGQPVISDAKMKAFWGKYEPAMKLLYSKDEMTALQNVRNAFEMENRLGRNISGVDGSQTKGMEAMLAHATEKAMPVLNWAGRAVRLAIGLASNNKAKTAQEFVVRAQFDPAFAKELAAVARVGKSEGEAAMKKALNSAIGRMSAAGTRSMATQDGSSRP